jgi:hypothetical protein
MNLQEVGGGCGDWLEVARDRDRWRALVSTVRTLRIPKMRGISWLAAEPVSFSRRTLLHRVNTYIYIYIYIYMFRVFTYSYLPWNVYRKRLTMSCVDPKKLHIYWKILKCGVSIGWCVYRVVCLSGGVSLGCCVYRVVFLSGGVSIGWCVYRVVFLSGGVSSHIFSFILFLLINTQRTSETAMQYTVLTKLIICCRVLLEKLIALWIIKNFQYRSYNSPPPVPIQRQFNPMHILHPPFFKLNFHITASSNSSQCSLSYRYPTKTLCAFLSPTCPTWSVHVIFLVWLP